jgi:uncharacterized protein YyaL (SSP411 family)
MRHLAFRNGLQYSWGTQKIKVIDMTAPAPPASPASTSPASPWPASFWKNWDKSLFTAARTQGRPVLLCLGDFPADAAPLAARLFLCTKIDPALRPDIDQTYRLALAMLGQAGGPDPILFLTEDALPFWGTACPDDVSSLLNNVAASYADEREAVYANARLIGDTLQKTTKGAAGVIPPLEARRVMAGQLQKDMHPVHAGFGGEMPQLHETQIYRFLWQSAAQAQDLALHQAVRRAVLHMPRLPAPHFVELTALIAASFKDADSLAVCDDLTRQLIAAPPVRRDARGLAITALITASLALQRPDCLAIAEQLFTTVPIPESGQVDHFPGQPGFLEDYAGMIRAGLYLYEATGNKTYLGAAERMTQALNRAFWHTAEGAYCQTEAGDDPLPIRPKHALDSDLPSGNGLMVENLQRLFAATGTADYEAKAESIQRAFGGEIARNFFPLATYLCGCAFYRQEQEIPHHDNCHHLS